MKYFLILLFGILGCTEEQIQPKRAVIAETESASTRTTDCKQLIAYLDQQQEHYIELAILAQSGAIPNSGCSRDGASCESIYRAKAVFYAFQIQQVKQQCQ